MVLTGPGAVALGVCLAAALWVAEATEDCTWKPQCPATGSQKFAIPCRGNCNRYFKCKNGTLTVERCFSTRQFNEQTRDCQWKLVFKGDCDWFLWHDKTQIKCPFEPECPAEGEAKLALPCDDQCNQYVLCKDGRWKVQTCTYAYQNFDHVSGECRPRSEVD